MADVTIGCDFGTSWHHRFEPLRHGPMPCPLYPSGSVRTAPLEGDGSPYDGGWLNDVTTCRDRRE